MKWLKIFKPTKKKAGWLLICLPLTAGFEGVVLKPYRDKLANNVWTVCAGETRNVDPNKIFTETECHEKLETGLQEFESQLSCIKAPLSDKTKAAIVSWSWNVGTGAACNSTLVRKLNSGDYIGACNELPKWNKAGGRVIQGLVNRRGAEKKLCLEGL